MPALRGPAIDPTGAGDVFARPSSSARSRGWPLADRLAFAALCSRRWPSSSSAARSPPPAGATSSTGGAASATPRTSRRTRVPCAAATPSSTRSCPRSRAERCAGRRPRSPGRRTSRSTDAYHRPEWVPLQGWTPPPPARTPHVDAGLPPAAQGPRVVADLVGRSNRDAGPRRPTWPARSPPSSGPRTSGVVPLLLGAAAFLVLFWVYASALQYAELALVTMGWIVVLQVGLLHRPVPLRRPPRPGQVGRRRDHPRGTGVPLARTQRCRGRDGGRRHADRHRGHAGRCLTALEADDSVAERDDPLRLPDHRSVHEPAVGEGHRPLTRRGAASRPPRAAHGLARSRPPSA